jgi:RNA polymerase sigma factor (sigma-70 family)
MEQTKRKPEETATVTALPFCAERWTDEEIVRGVSGRYPPAGRALFDRYHEYVAGRVRRLLGADSECKDQVQQVFAQVVAHIASLRDPEMLVQWINRITINTVRKELRRRKRRWFILYTHEMPEVPESGSQEISAVFQRALRVLNQMNVDERIAFVMRFVVREEVRDIAEMCGWSLSTAKRRIAKGRDCFMRRAALDPLLSAYGEALRNE